MADANPVRFAPCLEGDYTTETMAAMYPIDFVHIQPLALSCERSRIIANAAV
jgi:hypothetical protein